MGISVYLSNNILNNILGRSNFTIPNELYFGLSTTPVGENGTNVTEPVDPAYKRVKIPNDKSTFTNAINKTVAIKKQFRFDWSNQTWGNLTHFVIYDSLTSGNIWFYGSLQTPIYIEQKSAPKIPEDINQFRFEICGGSTSDMAISTDIANGLIDRILGNSTTLVIPDNYYFGLSRTPISPEGIGITEPVDGGYKRLKIPNDKNSFSMALNGTVTLAKDFVFEDSITSWGNITHFFISDSPTNGKTWWSGKLKLNRNVENKTTLVLAPDEINWSLTNCNLANPNPLTAIFNTDSANPTFWGR